MRLSDAIALGRTMVTPKAGHLFSFMANTGCALGMAGVAGGCFTTDYARYFEVLEKWPWLNEKRPMPCGCSGEPVSEDIVIHLFDDHVEQGNWTLDQLIDWVRSVEPQEEPVKDPEAEFMEARAGLNEPTPEEPELELVREGSAREKTGAHSETASASLPDKVGEAFIEETNRRVRLNSWAGAKLAIDELRKNGDVKL